MSSWIQHCKQYAAENNCSFKNAMIQSKSTYQKKNTEVGKGFSKFGEGIAASTFQKMLKSSYKKDGDTDIDGYELDPSISNETARVYHNPTTKKTQVVHRGTSGLSDWKNNITFALGGRTAYAKTDRYKKSEETQRKAEAKYTDVDSSGHSQGGLISQMVAGPNTKNIITLNTASHPFDFTPKAKNQTNVRSKGDLVSMFTRENSVSIPSAGGGYLAEHKTDVLDRLDPDLVLGDGLFSKYGRTRQYRRRPKTIDFVKHRKKRVKKIF